MPVSTECAAALLSFRYPSIISGRLRGRISPGFQRFTQMKILENRSDFFYNKQVFNNNTTFQVEICPINESDQKLGKRKSKKISQGCILRGSYRSSLGPSFRKSVCIYPRSSCACVSSGDEPRKDEKSR